MTISVVGAIEPTLRQAEIERARRKRPDSLDAYDLYLRALPNTFIAMPDTADEALDLLQQAIAIEPNYAWRMPPSPFATRSATSAAACLREQAHGTSPRADRDRDGRR